MNLSSHKGQAAQRLLLLLLLLPFMPLKAQEPAAVVTVDSTTVRVAGADTVLVGYDTTYVRTRDSARFVLKTDLFRWVHLSPNLGMEWAFNRKNSLALSASYNAWTLSDNRKWRHLLVVPEYRHWFADRAFDRSWLLGFNLVYSHYNAGNIRFPLGLFPDVRNERRQGDLYGVGAFVGYNWILSKHLNLSLLTGVDLGYADYDRYDCPECGSLIGHDDGLFAMPKLNLNLAWLPTKRVPVVKPIYELQPRDSLIYRYDTIRTLPPLPAFVPRLTEVKPNEGLAGELAKQYPVLHPMSEYRPYVNTRVLRKERGAIYVNYELDSIVLKPHFRDNAARLDTIIDITRQIMADHISSVRKIQIIGLASVEGPLLHNIYLSNNRARALKEYIQYHVGVPDDMFDAVGGGEAWSEFRDQLNDILLDSVITPDLRHSLERVMHLIDTEPDLGRREYLIRIMDEGRPFAYLLDHILADQRNAGYIRIFYDYVTDTLAEQINSTYTFITGGNYERALSELRTYEDDSRSLNAIGVALYYQGNTDEALRYFRRAADSGDPDGRYNLDGLTAYLEELARRQRLEVREGSRR